LRSVIHDPLFADSLHDLIGGPAIADEYVAAVESVLAESPEMGTLLESGVWMIPAAPIGSQSVAVYYTFDEDEVLLIAMTAF